MKIRTIHSSKVDFLSLEGNKIEHNNENRRYFENVNYRVGDDIFWNGEEYKIKRICVRKYKTFVVAHIEDEI